MKRLSDWLSRLCAMYAVMHVMYAVMHELCKELVFRGGFGWCTLFFMIIVPVKWVSREIITDIISGHYLQSVHVSASAICTHPGIITKIIADRVDDKMSAQVTRSDVILTYTTLFHKFFHYFEGNVCSLKHEC